MNLEPGKVLLDSNVVIYAASPDHPEVAQLIEDYSPAVLAISYVETLGFHGVTSNEKQFPERFFANSMMLGIDRNVLDEAVQLRQQRKMSLGDAIIAGTALVHDL